MTVKDKNGERACFRMNAETLRPAAFVSPNTFEFYLIHPLVLVAISVGMSHYSVHPIIKFTAASISTVVVCYALAEVLRRIPVVKEIL